MAAGADLELCHHHTAWCQWAGCHWRRRAKMSPTLLWWQLPEPWCPMGTVLLLSPPQWVSAEVIWQLHCSQASNRASWPASSATPSPRAGLWVKLVQMSTGPLTHRERDVTRQSVMLTSLGIPSDSSRGCSWPQWSSKCLNMKLLAYSVSSQRRQNLACQSIVSGKTTPHG